MIVDWRKGLLSQSREVEVLVLPITGTVLTAFLGRFVVTDQAGAADPDGRRQMDVADQARLV